MKLTMKNYKNEEITLDENDQSVVYEFYRLHCVMDRLNEDTDVKFKSTSALQTVAERVLRLMDDYHNSEDDAIDAVLTDTNYITAYIE